MRLAIAVPALDYGPSPFAFALARMYAVTMASVPMVTLAPMVGTFVHQAREQLLHDVTNIWGATHVLWIDADMDFPPDTALRLLRHGKDIVAANYTTRVPPQRPTARYEGKYVYSADKSGLEPVDHVGMGVFLMHASVVENLPRPRFWYSTPTETEDVYFCNLLRKAGHTIWIDHDLSHEVDHLGLHRYREQRSATVAR